jgi:Zn-dependent membrane protease YugP
MSFLDASLPYILVPALVIAVLGQLWVQWVLVRTAAVPVRMSGYAVARHVLDGAGLYAIEIQQVPGQLSDHFDARRRVLQLSGEVYHGRHVAALARAAHEACHALQHASHSRWMWVRDIAVPAASFASGGGILLAVLGLLGRFPPLLAIGILLFSVSVYLQLVSLPLEWHASLVAHRRLLALGIVEPRQPVGVRTALMAAATVYVGATLQSVFILLQQLTAWRRSRGN